MTHTLSETAGVTQPVSHSGPDSCVKSKSPSRLQDDRGTRGKKETISAWPHPSDHRTTLEKPKIQTSTKDYLQNPKTYLFFCCFLMQIVTESMTDKKRKKRKRKHGFKMIGTIYAECRQDILIRLVFAVLLKSDHCYEPGYFFFSLFLCELLAQMLFRIWDLQSHEIKEDPLIVPKQMPAW